MTDKLLSQFDDLATSAGDKSRQDKLLKIFLTTILASIFSAVEHCLCC